MEYKFEIIPNEQTPKVMTPVMSADTVLANKELYQKFLEFASAQQNAVGLAANQCSLNGERFNHRVFAIRDTEFDNNWRLIIDPVITNYIGMKELKLEGCLTWKGQNIVAHRFLAVEASYMDEDGQLISNEFWSGFDAQVFQHEYNHIEGIPEQTVPITFKLPPVKYPNRNDKCPCGSNRKYKHCCLLLIENAY